MLTTPLLPIWLGATLAHPRLRKDWRGRWGLDVPPVTPGILWVHAASVGEMSAAEGLIPELAGRILLTADTDTGVERARRIAAADPRIVAGVRPVDHPWTLAPLWAEARPRAVLLIEGTWWPQLAATARRAGVPVLRVSAKAGPRTRRWVRRLGHRWTAAVTVARDEGEAAFFREVGVRAVVGGDLKGARAVPPSPLRFPRPFVVGASTRPGEEELLLEARPRLPGDPQLLLAPRHPDRLERVEALLEGTRWTRRTALSGEVPPEVDVVLLDTLGELGGCLVGARAAFVGGTFDEGIGGHSPIEAARAGVPVVSGPAVGAHRDAFREVGARRVERPEELADALADAMRATPPVPWTNDAARRTMEPIRGHLDGPMAPEACPRPWAWPLSWPIRLVAALPWLGGRTRLTVPVIAVGSANARGPGKTSTARWIAEELRRRGHTPGIALRGYRRARPGRDLRISSVTTDAADLGDEGALHAAAGFLVAAGPDRVTGATALVALGATVVVLDDGLGVRGLHRDREVVVVDARFPGARGPLPAGERRPVRVGEGALVIAHHGPMEGAATARRRPGPWHRGDRPSPAPEAPVAVVLGVARPGDFLAMLELPVAEVRVLRDHAPIEDLGWAGELPVVCSAKDRARMRSPLRDRVFWRDVALEVEGVPESFWEGLGPS